ncbi:23S rRNA methyltransferase [Haloprofundus marisrubri]|uniref:Ribosomal RNA large subunit methyltransferase E n=1 Tax=Haloprofundus marisrubri TaxID=1514971 RepID=A0A0W1R482_9EURY|nr:23S rRNA (uridine(2552)-2'-O)-methyltransferase [Haloprofundus marisrubri]KTG08159.1 23S rRNA methyltransferase [Haloprofundus marisrubri]
MARKDEYYNRAKQEGYRARSAYKLQQLDETANLLHRGASVVDLGAAPGGWLQVAAEEVGPEGTVVGVDLQRIKSLDAENVETIRGDMTDEDTKSKLLDLVGEDGADVVISDMAPNMTGEYSLDHARSVYLARQAFEVAMDVLDAGGDLVVKVFDGQDLQDLKDDIDPEFQYVREVRPQASRKQSSELYLVAKGRITAPVSVGDELELDITDVGNEGDGIARVDGFTLFVSGADEGETVRVRVTDVKPKFGFAERVDDS